MVKASGRRREAAAGNMYTLANFQTIYKKWFKTIGEENDELFLDDDHLAYWWREQLKTEDERKKVFDRLKKAADDYESNAALQRARLVMERSRKIMESLTGPQTTPVGQQIKELDVATRCSPTSIVELMRCLSEAKKDIIKEMRFGGLLSLKADPMNRKELNKMLQHLNTETWEMEFPGATAIKLTPADLGGILQLKANGAKVPSYIHEIDDSAVTDEYIVDNFRNLKYIEMRRFIGDEEAYTNGWMQMLVLYIVGKYLCPTTSNTPEAWHHGAGCVALRSDEYNWAQYVFEHLKEKILAIKEGPSRQYIGGCTHFLLMVLAKLEEQANTVQDLDTEESAIMGKKRGNLRRRFDVGRKRRKQGTAGRPDVVVDVSEDEGDRRPDKHSDEFSVHEEAGGGGRPAERKWGSSAGEEEEVSVDGLLRDVLGEIVEKMVQTDSTQPGGDHQEGNEGVGDCEEGNEGGVECEEGNEREGDREEGNEERIVCEESSEGGGHREGGNDEGVECEEGEIQDVQEKMHEVVGPRVPIHVVRATYTRKWKVKAIVPSPQIPEPQQPEPIGTTEGVSVDTEECTSIGGMVGADNS